MDIPNTPNDIEVIFFSEILIFFISFNNDFYSFHSMLLEKKENIKGKLYKHHNVISFIIKHSIQTCIFLSLHIKYKHVHIFYKAKKPHQSSILD